VASDDRTSSSGWGETIKAAAITTGGVTVGAVLLGPVGAAIGGVGGFLSYKRWLEPRRDDPINNTPPPSA
jgi:hypothetical protein